MNQGKIREYSILQSGCIHREEVIETYLDEDLHIKSVASDMRGRQPFPRLYTTTSRRDGVLVAFGRYPQVMSLRSKRRIIVVDDEG